MEIVYVSILCNIWILLYFIKLVIRLSGMSQLSVFIVFSSPAPPNTDSPAEERLAGQGQIWYKVYCNKPSQRGFANSVLHVDTDAKWNSKYDLNRKSTASFNGWIFLLKIMKTHLNRSLEVVNISWMIEYVHYQSSVNWFYYCFPFFLNFETRVRIMKTYSLITFLGLYIQNLNPAY